MSAEAKLTPKQVEGLAEACKVVAKVYRANKSHYESTLAQLFLATGDKENVTKLLDATIQLINKGAL